MIEVGLLEGVLWDYDVVKKIQRYMQALPGSNNIVMLAGRAMEY